MSATTKRAARPAYAALVRGEDGGLHVRSFASGEDANAVARANPSLDAGTGLLTPAEKAWRHLGSPADVSNALGGHPCAATITRMCKTGGLPCRDDGCGAFRARYRLPLKAILASIAVRGLRATVAAHRAGRLIA